MPQAFARRREHVLQRGVDLLVLLDERGREHDSLAFARQMLEETRFGITPRLRGEVWGRWRARERTVSTHVLRSTPSR